MFLVQAGKARYDQWSRRQGAALSIPIYVLSLPSSGRQSSQRYQQAFDEGFVHDVFAMYVFALVPQYVSTMCGKIYEKFFLSVLSPQTILHSIIVLFTYGEASSLPQSSYPTLFGFIMVDIHK